MGAATVTFAKYSFAGDGGAGLAPTHSSGIGGIGPDSFVGGKGGSCVSRCCG